MLPCPSTTSSSKREGFGVMLSTRHDAFLKVENGVLYFGCENPFCCHGNPGLPNRWRIPLESKGFKMELLEHVRGERLRIRMTTQIERCGLPAGTCHILECEDTLNACSEAFCELWPEVKGET